LLRNSNWRSCIGIMMEVPQRLQCSVASGARSPGINTLASQPGQVTIRRGLSLALMTAQYITTDGGCDKPRFIFGRNLSHYPNDNPGLGTGASWEL